MKSTVLKIITNIILAVIGLVLAVFFLECSLISDVMDDIRDAALKALGLYRIKFKHVSMIESK